ncbi:MAG: carboxylase [Chloroflexota bacterium]
MTAVRFVDTTFRDGSQSLWAMGMRHGMMEAIAADMDRVGFDVIEVPGNAIHFKKIVRDLKEDPWAMMRMLAKAMPHTPKSCMGGGLNLNSFGTPTPPSLGQLFWKHMVEIGALNRVQLTANTADQLKRGFRTYIPFCKSIGLQVAIALSYSISPRHTDEHYAQKTREAREYAPDVIYLKDQGGLLTVDRLRALLPVIMDNAGNIPLEVHSHSTTGLAPLVYLEALKLGVPTIHTGIPPLADGSAQPSVLSVAKNVRLLGYSHRLDEPLLHDISARLTAIAKQDDMPLGAPLQYDEAQYIHQIPGGVISNLKYQLADIHLDHRLDDVIAECVRIRQDLGYPVMITPYSQYIGTQAALNVATGKRYEIVLDELIRFAQGAYGEDSGYTWMDANLRDRFTSLPRARELAELDSHSSDDISVEDIRSRLGADLSDEDLLLRAIMQGTREIDEMRRAGPPRRYTTANQPLVTLLAELQKAPGVGYVKIERGSDSIVIHNRAAEVA